MTAPTDEQQHDLLVLAVDYKGKGLLGAVLTVKQAELMGDLIQDFRSANGQLGELQSFFGRHGTLIGNDFLAPPTRVSEKPPAKRKAKTEAEKKAARSEAAHKAARTRAANKAAAVAAQAGKASEEEADKKASKKKASKKAKKKKARKKKARKKKAKKKAKKKGKKIPRKWVHTTVRKLKAFAKKFKTQAEAAEALGISHTSLGSYLGAGKKKRKVPTLRIQEKIASVISA